MIRIFAVFKFVKEFKALITTQVFLFLSLSLLYFTEITLIAKLRDSNSLELQNFFKKQSRNNRLNDNNNNLFILFCLVKNELYQQPYLCMYTLKKCERKKRD